MRHTESNNEAHNQAGAKKDQGLTLRAELRKKRNRGKTRQQQTAGGGKNTPHISAFL